MITWKRLREKKGYTLAELLVVIGIMGVLAAISFVAVSHYRKTLKLLEMDKTAQEIYIAAQNHFTQASTGSKFKEDVKKSLAGGSEINLGTKMTAKPADWDDAEYGSWDDVKDDMYYIQYNCSLGSDSDDLLNDSLLRYVLPYGAIDDTIRKDCQYVIEYNAASDAVYAVYYTDSTDEQLFEEAVLQASAGDANAWQYRNDPSNGATNRSRTAYNSGKVIIGYYGGGSIVLPYSLSLEENTVVVHNGNRLWAEVYCPVNETKIKDAGILLVDVKVTGEVSGAEKVLSFRVGKNPSDFVNNSPVKKSQAITDDEFSAMKLTGFRGFEFVLDDITESGGHFAQIFADADGDEDFIPGEDIRISAESTIADSSTAPKGSNEVVTNSLYSAVEEEAYVTSSNDPVAIKSEYKDKFTTTAKISTFRHLENLDPLISDVKNVSGTFEITQAFLINDITWKSADNKFEYVNDTNQDIYVRSRMRDGHTNGKITDCFSGSYFSAVPGYRGIVTPELSVFNGQDNRIISTYMVGDSSHSGTFPDAGLFRNVPEGFLIKDVVLEDTEVHAKGNAGLFIGNVDKALAASEYSGLTAASHTYDLSRTGYAAISDSTIKGHASVNCTNSDTLAPVPDAATFAFNADSGAGLLVGRYSGNGDLQINNVTDISIDREEMKLEAAEEAKLFDGKNVKPAYTEAVYGLNAGGLVGVMSPGADASITGRLYLGRLTDVSSAGGAAGGVIGSVTGTNRAGVYGYVLAKAEAGEKGVTGFDKNTEGKWVFAPSDTAYASPYLTGIVGILDQAHPDLTVAMLPPSGDKYGDAGTAYYYDSVYFSRYVPNAADRTLFNSLGLKAANITVRSDTSAGGFVGMVAGKGEFTNDMVYYRPLEGRTHLDGDACPQAKANVSTEAANGIAGGFVGSTQGSAASYFTNCGSQSIVLSKAGGSAGGFVGTAGGVVAFSRCYSGGHTVTNEATAGVSKFDTNHFNVTGANIAGGFVGTVLPGVSAYVAAEDTGYVFTHCFSTSSVEGKIYGGGFVGYDQSATYNFSGSYAAGLVKTNFSSKDSEADYAAPGNRKTGGFAGWLTCALPEIHQTVADVEDRGIVAVSYRTNGGGEVQKEYPKASYYYYGVNRSTDGITPVGNSTFTGAPVEIDSDDVYCPGKDANYFIFEAPYNPATATVRIDVNQVWQIQSKVGDTLSRKILQMDQTMTFVDVDSNDGTLRSPYIFSAFKENEAGHLVDVYHAAEKKYGISVGSLLNYSNTSYRKIYTAIYSDWQEPRQKTGFVYGYGYRETEAKVNGDKTMLEPVKETRTVTVKDTQTGTTSQMNITVNKYHWYVVNALKSKVTGQIYTQVVQDDLIKTPFGDTTDNTDPTYSMEGVYTLMVIPENGVEEETWDAEKEGYGKISPGGVLYDEFVKLYKNLNPLQPDDPDTEQLFALARLFNACDMVDFDGQLCHSYSFTSQVVRKAVNQGTTTAWVNNVQLDAVNNGNGRTAILNETYLCYGSANRWLANAAFPDLNALYMEAMGGTPPHDYDIYNDNTPFGKFVDTFYSFRYYRGKDGAIYVSFQRTGLHGEDNVNEAGRSADIITTPTGRSSGGNYYFFRFNTRFAATVDIVIGDRDTTATTDIYKSTEGTPKPIKRTDPNMEWGGYFNDSIEHPYLIRTAKQMNGVSVNLGGNSDNQRRVYMVPNNYFLQGADIWFGPGNYDSENGPLSTCSVVQGGGSGEDAQVLPESWQTDKYYGSGFYGFYSGAVYTASDVMEPYMKPYSTIRDLNKGNDNGNGLKYTVVLNQEPEEHTPLMGTKTLTSGIFMENFGTVEYLRSAGSIKMKSEKEITTDTNLIGGIAAWNKGAIRYCDSAVEMEVKLNPEYKKIYAIGGVAASSSRYKREDSVPVGLDHCVFEGKLTVNGTGNTIDTGDKKLRIGGVVGTTMRLGDGQNNEASSVTNCVNKGKIRVEAPDRIKAYCLDVGGIAGEAGTTDRDEKTSKTSAMQDDSGNFQGVNVGTVLKSTNYEDIYVGTKTLDTWLYVGGVGGSGSFNEREETSHKGGDFIDCGSITDTDNRKDGDDKGIVVAVDNIPSQKKSQWSSDFADYTVFIGGITGSLAQGFGDGDGRAMVRWEEKDTEHPKVAMPITLKTYDKDFTEYESGISIGGAVGQIIGNATLTSKAVVSDKAAIKVTAGNKINNSGFLAIGGVAGAAEAPYNSNRNFITDFDVKNPITVKSKNWGATKEPMIGGVTGRMYYGEIEKAKVSSEIKVDISEQLTNSAEMYVAGIIGCDGDNNRDYMSNNVNSCTYSGKLFLIPDRWVQSNYVYVGGISGRQLVQNNSTRGTNNVRNGALLEARIGHVKDGYDFYIGGIAGSTKQSGTLYSSMGVDATIHLYKASNSELDTYSGIYAGGAVGSVGEGATGNDLALNGSYVTTNFRNAFAISSNYLEKGELKENEDFDVDFDNGVYVGGLAGEKSGGRVRMNRAYVSVRFNNSSGSDSWGTNEAILVSTDSEAPLNGVEFKDCFAVQRTSYKFADTVSQNNAEFRDGTCQMAPYFYDYRGANIFDGESTMYAKFFSSPSTDEDYEWSGEISTCNFRYNQNDTFLVTGAVVGKLGDDEAFATMANEQLGWSKKKMYPVLTVNGETEDTGHMKNEIVWPMYIGTSPRQAERTLDIFSNLFNRILP